MDKDKTFQDSVGYAIENGLCVSPEMPYCPACPYGYIEYPDTEDVAFCKWHCLNALFV